MNESINAIEREILTHLFKSAKGLEAFTLYRKSKLSFSLFTKSLLSLVKRNFVIELKEEFYKISSTGIAYLNLTRPIGKEPQWRKIPDKYATQSIPSESFYVPSLKLLDPYTFKTIKKNVE